MILYCVGKNITGSFCTFVPVIQGSLCLCKSPTPLLFQNHASGWAATGVTDLGNNYKQQAPRALLSLMLSTTYQKTNSMSNIKFSSTCCQCLSNIDFSKTPDTVDVFSRYNQLKKLWQSFCREMLSISLKLPLYVACRWGFQQWFSIPLDLWITKFLPVKTLILSYFPTRSCWVADRVHLTLQADTSPASVEETT